MIMDEATERRIFAAMKSVLHDPEDEHVVISADGIGKGILRGNTIHLTQPLTNETVEECIHGEGVGPCPVCAHLRKELASDPPSE